jgi:hypothetical protein
MRFEKQTVRCIVPKTLTCTSVLPPEPGRPPVVALPAGLLMGPIEGVLECLRASRDV